MPFNLQFRPYRQPLMGLVGSNDKSFLIVIPFQNIPSASLYAITTSCRSGPASDYTNRGTKCFPATARLATMDYLSERFVK